MKKRSAYLGFKKVNDKLIALEKDGTITCWNSVTGKIIGANKVVEHLKLDKYSIFKMHLNDNTYLMDWYQDNLLLVNLMEKIKNVD